MYRQNDKWIDRKMNGQRGKDRKQIRQAEREKGRDGCTDKGRRRRKKRQQAN